MVLEIFRSWVEEFDFQISEARPNRWRWEKHFRCEENMSWVIVRVCALLRLWVRVCGRDWEWWSVSVWGRWVKLTFSSFFVGLKPTPSDSWAPQSAWLPWCPPWPWTCTPTWRWGAAPSGCSRSERRECRARIWSLCRRPTNFYWFSF